MKKLYVGNLPWDLTEAEFEEQFKKAGKVVSVSLIYDHDTKRSRGFGFVEMETEEEAKNAIEMFHQKESLKGRLMVVSEAKPRSMKGGENGKTKRTKV